MIQKNAPRTTHPAMALAACLAAAPTLCQAASEQVLYEFTGLATGSGPNSPLISVGGKFYGTTAFGGTHNGGTVFSVDTAGNHVVLYNFKQHGTESYFPVGGLIELGGTLYGVTVLGGNSNGQNSTNGTVFSITPQGAYKQIYSFKNSPADGQTPSSGLAVLGNLLYGTTRAGGLNGYGTVFSITPQGSESLLYSFQDHSDGYDPTSIIADGKMLYGTTYLGAGTGCDVDGCGAIFMLDPQGNETTLYSFGNGDQGGRPSAPLLKMGNQLYGSTEAGGGAHNAGTLFSLSLTGVYKDLYDFDGDNGEYPAGLVDLGGTLYGTAIGGPTNAGIVFTITKKGELTIVYNFQGGTDGRNPGNLLAVDGTLYGTTLGVVRKCTKIKPPECGTVFAVTP